MALKDRLKYKPVSTASIGNFHEGRKPKQKIVAAPHVSLGSDDTASKLKSKERKT